MKKQRLSEIAKEMARAFYYEFGDFCGDVFTSLCLDQEEQEFFGIFLDDDGRWVTRPEGAFPLADDYSEESDAYTNVDREVRYGTKYSA